MAKRPSSLIYSVDERPPAWMAILLGLQHVFVISVGWILPVVIVQASGGTTEQAASMIQMSMIASGLGTILQARTLGPLGSGYLCPFSCGPAYLSASIAAAKTGGLGLVFGLTAMIGLFEALVSQIVQRLRFLFPPEVTGLVVAMVGIELITLATPRFLGVQPPSASIDIPHVVVAFLTLVTMIGPSVWSRGRLRLFPVLLGLAVGYTSAHMLGVIQHSAVAKITAAPIVSFPWPAVADLSFQAAMLPSFLIASLASTLKSIGDLTLCQKANDTEWKRTEMKSVSGGILTGAVTTSVSGLLGGVGQSTFSSNVGLSIATGATSRHIALPCGVILILLAFVPKLATVFSVIPAPVMGAVLVYVACFMIVGGMQLTTSRMLDARRTFVVGIALIFGLSVEMVPGLYADLPDALSTAFGSPLALATVTVIALNLVFRIGVKTRVELELTPQDHASEKLFAFMENQGANWGARKEVITRGTSAMNEFVECVRTLELARGTIKATATFDEFNLDIDFRYDGALIDFPVNRPSEADLLDDEKAVAGLAGFLIRSYADRIQSSKAGDSCRVQLHFDH